MKNPLPFRHKARNYLHFDLPISYDAAKALASSPTRVTSHSFYPFLGFSNEIRKIKREEDGSLTKKVKAREIKIAAHHDAAIYAHYSDILAELYEEELTSRRASNVVTAFRRLPNGGTNIDFAGLVFDYIDHHRPCVALAFDLEKFFDTLDHLLLKRRWLQLLGTARLPEDHYAVFKSLTSFSWVDRAKAFSQLGISRHNPKACGRKRICDPKTFREQIRGKGLIQSNPLKGKGIPQGSPISAVLSNIYMLDFDSALSGEIAAVGGLYRRYCDDIMIVVKPEHMSMAKSLVVASVEREKLTLNANKTDCVYFPSGRGQPAGEPSDNSKLSSQIQYLGFTFDGVKRLIRPGSLGRYFSKMRAAVSLAKQTRSKYNSIEIARGQQPSALRTRKLYRQYSYLINRRSRSKGNTRISRGNFLSYAFRAAEKLNAPEIKRQVRNHWRKLQEQIRK